MEVESWARTVYLSRSCKRSKKDSRKVDFMLSRRAGEGKISAVDCGALGYLYTEIEAKTRYKDDVRPLRPYPHPRISSA